MSFSSLCRYRWYHGRQKVEGIETETGDGLLKLEKVERDMSGNYTVSASSVHGGITSSFTVNVLCKYCRCCWCCVVCVSLL